ncbi:hypothetical protein LJB88_00735, partial [Erysipelotrichaceae bacterium OttesenSCG-928-M19]|nr:hypothetical protein [Erysipelotrichaceae bacterium OttesenSCG-928-M19]
VTGNTRFDLVLQEKEVETYSVKYYVDDELYLEINELEEDEEITLADYTEAVDPNYEAIGWSKPGEQAIYAFEDSYTVTGNTRFDLVLKEKEAETYSVRYYVDDELYFEMNGLEKDDEIILPDYTGEIDPDYEVDGWAMPGGRTILSIGETYKISGNMRFDLEIIEKDIALYSVKYYVNGALYHESNDIEENEEIVLIKYTDEIDPNYEIDGWGRAGDLVVYPMESRYTVTEDIIFHMIFKEKEMPLYTVKYYVNGELYYEVKDVRENDEIVLRDYDGKLEDDYEISGWAKPGARTIYPIETEYTVTGDTVFNLVLEEKQDDKGNDNQGNNNVNKDDNAIKTPYDGDVPNGGSDDSLIIITLLIGAALMIVRQMFLVAKGKSD